MTQVFFAKFRNTAVKFIPCVFEEANIYAVKNCEETKCQLILILITPMAVFILEDALSVWRLVPVFILETNNECLPKLLQVRPDG